MTRSEELFEEAKRYIPGGVNSPVRAFKGVGGTPLFIEGARGSKLYDVDGKEYIDYICSWGALILGHAHPEVLKAVREALSKGTNYGAPTELEIKMARIIRKAFPSLEQVRMVNSGTEATMSAIRLARGYTGRDKIIKFEGCYHGHADYLLVKAGSGATTLGLPNSLGVPVDFAKYTLSVPYNDLEELERVIKENHKDTACCIVEPVAGNMGVVPPKGNFLKGLREITSAHHILLIFDEVITGFRLAYGGAQEYYGVEPDLTCLGKIIGGGFPVGAYGGKAEIMQYVAPQGAVYQAGTLSGNPIALTAGLKTLEILSDPRLYEELRKKAELLKEGLERSARKVGVDVFITGVESMLSIFFTGKEVYDYRTATEAEVKKYAAFFHSMLEEGIYLAPSQFEAMFISTAHTETDIKRTIEASSQAFKASWGQA